MPKKILLLIGTRPELIKLAPVVKALQAAPDLFTTRVCFSGQHRQLLAQAAASMEISPDLNLDLMEADQSLAGFASRALVSIDAVLQQECPDFVLVQGDTTTAFCGTLAAFYHKIAVGHVEAGLRTSDKYAPFPEEINRRLISHIADLHFAPTELAGQNLLKEGIGEESVFVTGNTVIDALHWMRARMKDYQPNLPKALQEQIAGMRTVLITGHRRENFGEGFEQICSAIAQSARQHPDVLFVYPVHLNPKVQEPVRRILGNQANILLIDPLDYPDFVWLMNQSWLVLTDSGGVQEEAPGLGKPVLVMRDVTERPEGVTAGSVRLVGADSQRIIHNLEELLGDAQAYNAMAQVRSPYGDGKAAEKIVSVLKDFSAGSKL